MKKIVALILAVMLLSTVCFATAFAGKAEKTVEKANAKIEKVIEKAQKSAKDDGAKAQAKTDKIAEKAKEKVEKLGGEVECIYTFEEIDGVIYAIDPLIVINPHVVKK